MEKEKGRKGRVVKKMSLFFDGGVQRGGEEKEVIAAMGMPFRYMRKRKASVTKESKNASSKRKVIEGDEGGLSGGGV